MVLVIGKTMGPEELDTLQSCLSACNTIAFADISTRMVLITNSNATLDRGMLDSLCAEASMLLNGSNNKRRGINSSHVVIRRTPKESVAFVRSDVTPDDALIIVCEPQTLYTEIIPEAQKYLRKVGLD